MTSGINTPVFSPDGRSVAFLFQRCTTARVGRRRCVDARSAAIEPPFGVSWHETGLLVGQGGKGIVRCPANGGTPEQLVTAERRPGGRTGPSCCPEGRRWSIPSPGSPMGAPAGTRRRLSPSHHRRQSQGAGERRQRTRATSGPGTSCTRLPAWSSPYLRREPRRGHRRGRPGHRGRGPSADRSHRKRAVRHVLRWHARVFARSRRARSTERLICDLGPERQYHPLAGGARAIRTRPRVSRRQPARHRHRTRWRRTRLDLPGGRERADAACSPTGAQHRADLVARWPPAGGAVRRRERSRDLHRARGWHGPRASD